MYEILKKILEEIAMYVVVRDRLKNTSNNSRNAYFRSFVGIYLL